MNPENINRLQTILTRLRNALAEDGLVELKELAEAGLNLIQSVEKSDMIPGIKPFVVLATRKGETAPTAHLTGSFDTEHAARMYVKDCLPTPYTAQVYKITAKALPPDHHNRAEIIARNGRCGTCGGCPEHCQFTKRYDHNISADRG